MKETFHDHIGKCRKKGIMDIQIVIDDLRNMGIGRQYLGYKLIIKAVRMILEDDNRLLCIKREIFLPLAEQEHCDWRTIERNLRTIIHRAWKINRDYLIILARYPTNQEPTVTEFVEILSEHAMKGRFK